MNYKRQLVHKKKFGSEEEHQGPLSSYFLIPTHNLLINFNNKTNSVIITFFIRNPLVWGWASGKGPCGNCIICPLVNPARLYVLTFTI